MNADHTPGPWKARDYRVADVVPHGNAQPGSIWIDCVAYTKRGVSLGGTVAEVYARGCAGPSEQEANARLVAASPSLLNALREAIPGLQSLVAQQCPDPAVAACDKRVLKAALAAVAQATGATP